MHLKSAAAAIALFALAFVPTTEVVAANSITANDLANHCRFLEISLDGDSRLTPKAALCAGIFHGVMQTLSNEEFVFPKNERLFCIPNGVTVGQMMRIFMKFSRDNPDLIHQEYISVIYASVVEAFPCKSWQGVTQGRK